MSPSLGLNTILKLCDENQEERDTCENGNMLPLLASRACSSSCTIRRESYDGRHLESFTNFYGVREYNDSEIVDVVDTIPVEDTLQELYGERVNWEKVTQVSPSDMRDIVSRIRLHFMYHHDSDGKARSLSWTELEQMPVFRIEITDDISTDYCPECFKRGETYERIFTFFLGPLPALATTSETNNPKQTIVVAAVVTVLYHGSSGECENYPQQNCVDVTIEINEEKRV